MRELGLKRRSAALQMDRPRQVGVMVSTTGQRFVMLTVQLTQPGYEGGRGVEIGLQVHS